MQYRSNQEQPEIGLLSQFGSICSICLPLHSRLRQDLLGLAGTGLELGLGVEHHMLRTTVVAELGHLQVDLDIVVELVGSQVEHLQFKGCKLEELRHLDCRKEQHSELELLVLDCKLEEDC